MISPALRRTKPFNLLAKPGPGCVLWLPGQDDAYSVTIRDRSGNNYNGAIIGANWIRNSKGLWVLSFDGTNDVVNVANGCTSFSDGSIHSVDVWFMPSVSWAAKECIIVMPTGARYATIAYNMTSWVAGYAGKLLFTTYQGEPVNSWTSATHTVTLSLNTWYHAAGTYDGTNLRLYLNGILVATQACATYTKIDNSFQLGHALTPLQGSIALTSLYYNKVLTAEKIANTYNITRPLFGV